MRGHQAAFALAIDRFPSARSLASVVAALCALTAAGCEVAVPQPGPATAPQNNSSAATSAAGENTAAAPTTTAGGQVPAVSEPGSADAASTSSTPSPTAVSPAPPSGSTAPPSAPNAPAPTYVSLSRGISLAQTGPEGTMMGFSVEYRVAGGPSAPGSKHFWLIKPAQGNPSRQEISLRDHGTLEGFFPLYRPEHGPFEACVIQQDALGKESQVSAFITLK